MQCCIIVITCKVVPSVEIIEEIIAAIDVVIQIQEVEETTETTTIDKIMTDIITIEAAVTTAGLITITIMSDWLMTTIMVRKTRTSL